MITEKEKKVIKFWGKNKVHPQRKSWLRLCATVRYFCGQRHKIQRRNKSEKQSQVSRELNQSDGRGRGKSVLGLSLNYSPIIYVYSHAGNIRTGLVVTFIAIIRLTMTIDGISSVK